MLCRLWVDFLTTFILLGSCSSQDGLTLQCRDNDNSPADWWYIYKPPSRTTDNLDPGTNFSYIWSGASTGRWRRSDRPIDDSTSMLQHTLRPMFSRSQDRIAAIVYTSSKGFMGTSAMGILLADDTGAGLWLGHTVPDYPESISGGSEFPSGEMLKGHMFACISLTQEGLNLIAKALDVIAPAVTDMLLPISIAPLLPDWENLQLRLPSPGTKLIYGTTFHSRHGKRFTLLARIPGDKRCLYESFADSRKVVLDVYGKRDDGLYSNVCVYASYGVRNIESIAVKYPSEVQVNPITWGRDRARFAISTTANWLASKDRVRANNSYWVCVSNLDKEEKRDSPGGMLMCVEDVGIWRAFDNMKVSEPTCVYK